MQEYRYQSIATHISDLIKSKALAPGQKLPSLRGLSASMKVSLSTASQAYLELEKKGIIQAKPRSGFFVSHQFDLLPQPAPPVHTDLSPSHVNRSQLIQTVLKILGDSSLVPLGIISPSTRLLPLKILKNLMREALSCPSSLEYAPVEGLAGLRCQISMLGIESGLSMRPEDIIITSGAMEALYIALRCITRPGDNVLIQSPSYFCFLQLLENMGLRAIEVPSDSRFGVKPADIDQALRQFDIRACILAPNFNNPDGSLTNEAAKKEITTILRRHCIPLVEDDVSGDVCFSDSRPGTCKAHDHDDQILLCSSFSKTIAPGYRTGWLVPGKFMSKAREIKATTSVCSSTPTQMVIAAYLKSGKYPAHLKNLKAAIMEQMHLMQSHLSRHFPSQTRASRPLGGSVLWVELPEKINAVEYFFKARDLGIGIAPGSVFSTQDKYKNFIRLSCGGVWEEKIEKGIETLGKLATEMAG